MKEQREPELEEIDEYEGKESPAKRRLVRWVLLAIFAVILFLGFWQYQEMQLAQDRMNWIQETGSPMPATR